MYQVPARVWNAIAKTQKLRTPSFQQLMAMPDDQLLEALDVQAKALTASKVPDGVISAYLELAPLLAEHQAISSYIEQTGNISLRAALPEILSAAEAVEIAALDRWLSSSEKELLQAMLTCLELAISIDV